MVDGGNAGDACTTDGCEKDACTHVAVVCGGPCMLGLCSPITGCAVGCDDSNPCTADTCAEDTKVCGHVPLPLGATCGADCGCGESGRRAEIGQHGAPCSGDQDCDANVCLKTEHGQVCTKVCVESCPPGWTCKPWPKLGSTTWACQPDSG